MKKFGFFSLGEIFIGNEMGKWGGKINPNTFGNMAHPNTYVVHQCFGASCSSLNWKSIAAYYL